MGRFGVNDANANVMYVSVYVMKRTTVYLRDEQAHDLKQAALRSGKSEAELLREGVDRILSEYPARPRGFQLRVSSGDPTWSSRVDEYLAQGFGTDGLSR